MWAACVQMWTHDTTKLFALITGGAKLEQDVPRVTSIDVFPKNPIILEPA